MPSIRRTTPSRDSCATGTVRCWSSTDFGASLLATTSGVRLPIRCSSPRVRTQKPTGCTAPSCRRQAKEKETTTREITAKETMDKATKEATRRVTDTTEATDRAPLGLPDETPRFVAAFLCLALDPQRKRKKRGDK